MALCPGRAWSVLFPLVLALPALAQWRQVPATSLPPVRTGFSVLPLASGGVLLFGGDANNPAATEWRWTGTEWVSQATPVPRRAAHASAVHPPSGDLLVFGGVGAGSVPLTDTWRFAGGTWSQLQPLHSPPSLTVATMAFDAHSDAFVLAGKNGTAYETWSFAGGDWSLLTTAALPAATSVQLVADSVRGEAIAFVIEAHGLHVHRLQSGSWNMVGAVAGVFASATATFDDARGRAVWFSHPVGQPGQTYEWDGLRLLPRPSPVAPPVLNATEMAIAYDSARAECVLVASTSQLSVWSWSPRPAPLASAYGLPCSNPQLELRLVAGDIPQPGARHRLQVAGSGGNELVFSLVGLSHTDDGAPLPRPFPVGAVACQQRVQILAPVFLGVGLPATLQFTVPNSATFLGFRYDAQFVLADVTGIVDATNGLEVQVGLPMADSTLSETFASATLRDAMASGDAWGGGAATPVAIGGDGRHGSFDPSFGTLVAPGQYLWNTDSITIPGTATQSGQNEVVTDGRFFFTDFVLPAGVTVEFAGALPPQIFVRGMADVAGTLRCNGAAMTTFNGRGTLQAGAFVNGQPGGLPGAGGGRGGNGGDECRGTGPIIVNGVTVTNGQPGQDVRVAAGHAYAANAVGTGGRGSSMNPATGIAAPNVPAISSVYRSYFAPGGGGGGFSGPGGSAAVTPFNNLQVGPIAAPGTAFSLMPFPPISAPPGYSSLEHFLVGGSGGGGGATHAFGTFTVTGDVYIAGAAGSGGGGALALRAGGDVHVAGTASLQAKGGAGVLIHGRDASTATNVFWGVTSPGGGGSGGSVLLQAAGDVMVHGDLDTTGGDGSRTGQVFIVQINVQSQAGAGSPGFFRVEAGGSATVMGTTVPAFVAGTNSGPLLDRDARTGSRSVWLRPPTLELPRYVRYELVADIGGNPVLFSDDPAISSLAANDPNGAVQLRLQGAQVDPLSGQVLVATRGPWRTTVMPGADSLNQDRAEALRFDLVLDKNLGATAVRELRIVWR